MMTPIQCRQKRVEWESYEVGGSRYGNADYTGLVNIYKKQYADGGCGADPLMEKCLERELYIKNLQEVIRVASQQNNLNKATSTIEVLNRVTKDFTDSGCEAKIEESRRVVVQGISDKYSAIDKQRIEAETKYESNKKIFIGGTVLLISVALIFVLKRD